MDEEMDFEEIATDSPREPRISVQNNGVLEDTDASNKDSKLKANNSIIGKEDDLITLNDELECTIVSKTKDKDLCDDKNSVDEINNSNGTEKVESNSHNTEKVETNSHDTAKVETNSREAEKAESNSHETEEVESNSHKTDKVESNSHEIHNDSTECNTSDDVQKTDVETSASVKITSNETVPVDSIEKSIDAENKSDESKDVPKNKDSLETESKAKDSESTEVSKKKEESGKKKKGKICSECKKKRKIEFRIHFQGNVLGLCSETCYKQFKDKQNAPKPAPEPPKPAEPAQDCFCPECQKLIFPNQGYYPVVGDIKPLCSEDCVRKYQDNNGPPRKCSQCENKVEDKSCHLTWETMVFCSEDCLGKYQSFLGSHCTCCQAPVQQASLGKYCVCFGSDIRQFCSGSCLDDFKKGLKVCTFCQTDLSAGSEGFLAPVGDKGQFKDFCSQACMERYETMNNISKSAPEVQECGHCKKQGTFKIQVSYNDKKYFLCCDNCVAGLRCTLKKTDNVCSSCHSFFRCSNDFNSKKEKDYKLKLDGLYKFFCSKTCMTTYVLSHRRITQCLFCKVKKYNFDMIEKTDRSVGSQIFCSLNCLSLYRVNVNAASSKSIRCDNCSKTNPAQYHLTMSDGSIRNFCTYNCVLAFQNQFTSVPALTTTSMTRQVTTPVQTLKTTSAISSPVIANVVSLAQPRTTTLTKPLVPQALVSVRPTRQPVAVFTTKPQVSSSTAVSPSVPLGQTSSSTQVMREVIVQPPAPKSVKNKTVWCKPIMQTKGVNAKTPACNKAVQTDDRPRPIIFPVPVPIYVPTPLHMFSRPVPCPVPFPVPIPIPILIPSSKESHNQVMKHFRKIQGSLASNSHKDEVSSDTIEKSMDDTNRSSSDIDKQSDDGSNEDIQTNEDECENGAESESIYYIKSTKNSKRTHSPFKHKKHKKIKLDGDTPSEESRDTLITEDESSSPSISTSFATQPGTSFQEGGSPTLQNSPFETPSFSFEEEEQTMLKMKYGMNALKLWLIQKNASPFKNLSCSSESSLKTRKFYKSDILLLSSQELESYLMQFVQEARTDTNGEYSGGAVYFLCLSIQFFLLENGKTDNIFTDRKYETFQEIVHNILVQQETKAFLSGQPLLKNKEEILWDADQLGVQSPLVLLNTLIYFFTKYFRLKTVEEHARLRFSNVMLITNNNTQTASLRYYPKGINQHNGNGIMEIKERPECLIRCPVKLYEFYLQRCPPQAMEKDYPLYLEPEVDCSPETNVWYSPYSMSRELINRQFQRLKFIQEAEL